MEDLKSYCYTLDEMAEELGITVESLRGRIYQGKNHPPYQCPTRGVYWFPKELAVEWAKKNLKVTHEVADAS